MSGMGEGWAQVFSNGRWRDFAVPYEADYELPA
jgi:hypothetical protein